MFTMGMQRLWGLGGLIAAVGALLGGCSAGEPVGEENVSETGEALRASGIVDVFVDVDYYCGSVNLFNNSGSAISGWTAIVRPPLGGSFDTGWDATFDPPAADGSVKVYSTAANGSIAPMGTKTAAFTVCVNRVDAGKFTVTNALATSCPTYYRDSDHDGYGDATQPLSACTPPADYVTDATDCCDTDARAFPGQTAYYSTASACGNYDFNCSGAITKKSNGPTGCYEAPMTCTMSGDTCVASAPPAGCNNEFRSNGTASCGQTWITSVKGCTIACTPGGCNCMQWSNGGPGGTQSCQ
jgi:hypothetical protein